MAADHHARLQAAGPMVAGTAIAAGLGILAWMAWPDDGATTAGEPVQVVVAARGAGTGTPAMASSPGIGLALVSTFVGGTAASSSATLAAAGAPPRLFRIGDTVTEGIVLAEVALDHVVLVENGIRTTLYRLTTVAEAAPGERRGLVPEPVRPSGEMTGDEIARRMQAANMPVERTPEEIAAGR